MDLQQIHSRDEFSAFYAERGLTSVADKIAFLKDALKICGSCGDADDTPQEELTGLEDLVMSHLWEALQ